MKTTWYWHKNRHVDQWNQIEDPDMNAHTYVHLVFEKVRNTYWKKKTPSLTNGTGQIEWLHIECKYIHIYHSVQNSNPKMIFKKKSI